MLSCQMNKFPISGVLQTAVYILRPLKVCSVLGAGPEQSGIYNGLMTNSTSETPYDAVMKTAEVELSCHMSIDLQSRYLWHRK